MVKYIFVHLRFLLLLDGSGFIKGLISDRFELFSPNNEINNIFFFVKTVLDQTYKVFISPIELNSQ